MAQGRASRWMTAGCLALLAGSAALATVQAEEPATEWRAHAFPGFPSPGCIKTAWLEGAIYGVRTPLCSFAPDQKVTFERYTPATGKTEVLAKLPSEAVQATVKEIDGRLYVFTPQRAGVPAVPTHVYDPHAGSSGALTARSSVFPGTSVDAPTFSEGQRLTFVSGCVWSCPFVRYDAATDSFTTLAATLPNQDPVLAKAGLIWDGAFAHILTFNHVDAQWRFYDYDPATDTLAPGSIQSLPGQAGPLLQSGPTQAILAVTAGSLGSARIASFDLVTSHWSIEPGILDAAAAPRLWGAGYGWAFAFGTGGISCVAPTASCTFGATAPGAIPDADGDGFADTTGEGQAPPPADTDSDGRADAVDNCMSKANPDQVDRDRDGLGDACDTDTVDASGPVVTDADGDFVADLVDNCPAKANANQNDRDGDAIGDVCDVDRDGDGIVQLSAQPGAFLDNCPDYANADQQDSDGDGVGDLCSQPGLVAPIAQEGLTGGTVAPAPSGPDAATAVGLAAAGAAVVGGIAVAWNLRGRWVPGVAVLFSRQMLQEPDTQPSRRALLAAIEAHPGIHFNELARLTAQGRGAVQHHLKILEERGSVRMVRFGRYTCVYPAQAPAQPGDGVLKSDVARRLEHMVRDQPGMTAAEASRMLGVTYGATAYHMRRMAEAGLVRLEDKPLAAYPIPHGPTTPPVTHQDS